MIATNYTTHNSSVSFSGTIPNGTSQQENIEKLYQMAEELNKPKEKITTKTVKEPKIGPFLKKAGKAAGSLAKEAGEIIYASGQIAISFIWKRLSALAMCLWTIPGIIAAVTGATILICRNYIDKHEYPNGHEKYQIEMIDNNAAKLDGLYETNPEKYYKKCNSAIFDYYDALNQIKSEKETLETKIANQKK